VEHQQADAGGHHAAHPDHDVKALLESRLKLVL
jgi:hypothetical protein